MKLLSVCTVVLLGFGSWGNNGASADSPTALVEEVLAGSPNVIAMEFLRAGQTLELGTEGKVVLSYLRSCTREEISGGRVMVGSEQSDIVGGVVVRERVNCDVDQFVLTQGQTDESAAAAFRAGAAGDPVVTVYGTRPVFLFGSVPDVLLLERRDLRQPVVMLKPDGPMFDLARTMVQLVPGGEYRVTSGDQVLSLRVDRSARRDRVPVVSRLVRF